MVVKGRERRTAHLRVRMLPSVKESLVKSAKEEGYKSVSEFLEQLIIDNCMAEKQSYDVAEIKEELKAKKNNS